MWGPGKYNGIAFIKYFDITSGPVKVADWSSLSFDTAGHGDMVTPNMWWTFMSAIIAREGNLDWFVLLKNLQKSQVYKQFWYFFGPI